MQVPACFRTVFRSLKKKTVTQQSSMARLNLLLNCMEEIRQGDAGKSWFRMIYMGTRDVKWQREARLLSHELQNGSLPPCFLTCFSESRLSAAVSKLSPTLGQQFMSKKHTGQGKSGKRLCMFMTKGLYVHTQFFLSLGQDLKVSSCCISTCLPPLQGSGARSL